MARGGRRLSPEELKGRKVDWRLFRAVLRLARPYLRHALAFAGLTAMTSLLVAAPPLLFRQVIDEAIPRRDLGLLTRLSLGAVGLILLRSVLSLGASWQSASLGNGMVFELRRRLYQHVHRMPPAFFTSSQTGALLSRMSTDVQGAQQVLSGVITAVASSATQLISVVAVMAALDLRLTAIVLTVIPAFLMITRVCGRVLQRATREQLELMAGMGSFLSERLTVSGANLVHLFGDHDREAAEMAEHAGGVRRLTVRISVLATVVGLLVGLATSTATSGLYLYGGTLAIDRAITVGTVVLFASYAERVYAPLNDLTSVRVDLLQAMVSFERVFEVLDLPNPVADRAGAIDLVECAGRVEYEDVSFRYPSPEEATLASLRQPGGLRGPRGRAAVEPIPAQPTTLPPARSVLQGVSLVAEPGQLVALVGPTGAGKTTTLMLLARLADPTTGRIRIDGHDLRDLTLSSVRRHVGVVSQDAHLFHDTVMANLRYARPSATDQEVESACRLARIHDVIATLPDGYETMCGERGHRFSGGEKQRLAIARLVLKDPAIVVLDEATAHLDSRNELLVQEALQLALAGRTTLAIAHRLSTVRAADTIVVLDGGRVAERGTHDELLARAGLYEKLHTIQAGAVR